MDIEVFAKFFLYASIYAMGVIVGIGICRIGIELLTAPAAWLGRKLIAGWMNIRSRF